MGKIVSLAHWLETGGQLFSLNIILIMWHLICLGFAEKKKKKEVKWNLFIIVSLPSNQQRPQRPLTVKDLCSHHQPILSNHLQEIFHFMSPPVLTYCVPAQEYLKLPVWSFSLLACNESWDGLTCEGSTHWSVCDPQKEDHISRLHLKLVRVRVKWC